MIDEPSGLLMSPQEHMEQANIHAKRAHSTDPRNRSAHVESNLALTHALIAHTIEMGRQDGGNPFRGYDS